MTDHYRRMYADLFRKLKHFDDGEVPVTRIAQAKVKYADPNKIEGREENLMPTELK